MTWREEREAGPSDSATDSPANKPDDKTQIIRIKKQIIRIKRYSGSGPEVLQPPRLKNKETGEGSKFTIKTRAAIKVFAMSYSIWKPKRGIVQSTMVSQVYLLETRQVLLQRSHSIRWEASTNLWVNWLQFLWERISLTHMWENEFKSKGWRFVSSPYNIEWIWF